MRFHHPELPRSRLERAEALAEGLSAGDLLGAISRTARLDAVLRTRYGALEGRSAAPPPIVPPDGPRYLDATQAGQYLGVSKSTVVRLASAGKLRALRPSQGVVRFDRRELDAYMARHPVGAGIRPREPPDREEPSTERWPSPYHLR